MPKPKAKASLKEMYTRIVESLQATITDIDENIMYYHTVNYHNWDDDDFLETMAQVIFASYLDWDIVEKKWRTIRQAFSCFDVDRVASYIDKDVKVLMRTSGIIKNKRKIKGIIENAKQMQEIIKEYRSFANYVCFYPYDLKEDLLRRFYGLGVTAKKRVVLDFMKEMGFPVIKDDEHVRRVFYRLGLTNSEDVEQEEILRIGKEIAVTVKERMPVIDCVFWSFGHYICKADKPDCEECSLVKLCKKK
jgi:DNA-3-methyladenine glycosylase I